MDSYLRDIDKTPLLTAEQEHDLALRVERGDVQARDELARANLRLVVRIAREYAGRGLPLEDLISEGNIGLMRAVEGFNAHAGTRFSTYAAFWIKQSIRIALNKGGHAVRLPHYVCGLLVKWRRSESSLRNALGRDATREEIAADLGLTRRQLQAVLKAQKAMASVPGGTDDADFTEMLADARSTNPETALEKAESLQAAIASLGYLGEREAEILRLRFGLTGEEPATLRDVGERLGLTRERVRQIERDSLVSLREMTAA
jgi:RNA polymerase primary sigma factor